jgi:hypothetical protein
MGISVVAWRGLVAEDMLYHNMAFRPIDLEPDSNTSYQQLAADCRFTRGVSTGWNGNFDGQGIVDASAFYLGTPYDTATRSGFRPLIENVVIEDQVVQDGITGIRTIFEGRGYRIRNVTIRRNRGVKQAAGIGGGGWCHGTGADIVKVTDNAQPVPSGTYAVALSDSTGIIATGNAGAGLAGQIKP